MANGFTKFFSPKATGEAIGRMFKPAKTLLVDMPKTLLKTSKGVLYDAPKGIKNFAFSKKGALLLAGILGSVAVIKGMASRSGRNEIENSQTQEAMALQEEIMANQSLRASTAANRQALVATSVQMGQNSSMADGKDAEYWRRLTKGGVPGQQLPS